MSSALGPSDFFALEAGEYLERLASIVENPDGPKRDEFVRFARALRGSALMANQTAFASAAAGLEAVARSYRDGNLEWDSATKERAAGAIEDLKQLLRQAGTWDQEHTLKADRLARDLEQTAGQTAPLTQRRTTDDAALNAGVRAFIAREGALIASALERAGRTLAGDPGNIEAVHNVVRRMQSLRGLAELSDLSPLPEMLEGLELASSTLSRTPAPPPDVAEVFHAAARAMTKASRDVAEQGRPNPEAEEAQRFSSLLIGAFALEEDVVDIAMLAPDDGESIATPGMAPSAGGSLAAVDFVSQGERLTEMAETLTGAASRVEMELGLFAIIDTLQALNRKAGAGVGGAFSVLAITARQRLGQVHHADAVTEFGRHLAEAAEMLKAGTSAGESATSARLRALAERLDEGTPAPVEAPVAETPAPIERPTPVTERQGQDDAASPIVSVTDLAPDTPASPGAEEAPRRQPEILPEPVIEEDKPGLAGSLATYHRLRQEDSGSEPTTLDGFLAPPATPAAPPPASTPAPAVAPTAAVIEVVEIDALLYRGPAAQERAKRLGALINDGLADPARMDALRPLLEELIDLLPLAAEPVVG